MDYTSFGTFVRFACASAQVQRSAPHTPVPLSYHRFPCRLLRCVARSPLSRSSRQVSAQQQHPHRSLARSVRMVCQRKETTHPFSQGIGPRSAAAFPSIVVVQLKGDRSSEPVIALAFIFSHPRHHSERCRGYRRR